MKNNSPYDEAEYNKFINLKNKDFRVKNETC